MLSKIRAKGFLYSAGIIINKVVPQKLFRARVFQVFRLGQAEDSLERSASPATIPLSFRWCDSESDRRQAEELTFYRPDHNSQQHRACLAIQHDEVVGGVWVGTDEFDESELGVRMKLQEDQVWLFAAYVSRDHRGKGIYRRLLDHVLEQYADKQVFASINPTNRLSIAAHRVYVRKVVGTAYVGRLLGKAVVKCSGQLKADRRIGRTNPQPIEIRIASTDATTSKAN